MSAAAIVAVIHDIIFTVGVYASFHFPVTPATITAFLTILGFSLYDTVVVFDKVRENERVLTATGRTTYSEMVNKSLNQVLMRSLSTSFVALDAGDVPAVRRRRGVRCVVAAGVRRSALAAGCSSVRTRRSSSRPRSWRGGRNGSRSTGRWPTGGPRVSARRRRSSRHRWRPLRRRRRVGRPPTPPRAPSRTTPSAPESVGFGVPGPPAVGRSIQPRCAATCGASASSPGAGPQAGVAIGYGGSLGPWPTRPRYGARAATFPTGPGRASSFGTSRRCSPRPMPSRSRSTSWPRRTPRSRSTR